MDELTICMAGVTLLLVVVNAWIIREMFRSQWRLEEIAKAASAYLQTYEGDAVHGKARGWLLDCLSEFVEDK